MCQVWLLRNCFGLVDAEENEMVCTQKREKLTCARHLPQSENAFTFEGCALFFLFSNEITRKKKRGGEMDKGEI